LPDVKDTCDFVGINYYSRLRVGFEPRSPKTLFFQITVPPHKPQGDSGIEVPYGEAYPQGLRNAVEHFVPFNKPIYILENGVPDRADRIRPWVLDTATQKRTPRPSAELYARLIREAAALVKTPG
jgi:beta-glucosidase